MWNNGKGDHLYRTNEVVFLPPRLHVAHHVAGIVLLSDPYGGFAEVGIVWAAPPRREIISFEELDDAALRAARMSEV